MPELGTIRRSEDSKHFLRAGVSRTQFLELREVGHRLAEMVCLLAHVQQHFALPRIFDTWFSNGPWGFWWRGCVSCPFCQSICERPKGYFKPSYGCENQFLVSFVLLSNASDLLCHRILLISYLEFVHHHVASAATDDLSLGWQPATCHFAVTHVVLPDHSDLVVKCSDLRYWPQTCSFLFMLRFFI